MGLGFGFERNYAKNISQPLEWVRRVGSLIGGGFFVVGSFHVIGREILLFPSASAGAVVCNYRCQDNPKNYDLDTEYQIYAGKIASCYEFHKTQERDIRKPGN